MTHTEPAPGGTREMSRRMSSAEICRAMKWPPGTRLVGDEGYGPATIEITAVGERDILAKRIDKPWHENTWTLSCRDWERAPS